jgi:hypothetical protein
MSTIMESVQPFMVIMIFVSAARPPVKINA